MIKNAKVKKSKILRAWHEFDARNQILGRMASQIAMLLQGKNKPYYVPHLDCGDHVVVVNAKDIKVTGNKEKSKVYYSHSNYPGGLKSQIFSKLKADKPEEIIYNAIWGMVPKTKLGRQMIKKLHIYKDNDHPYKDKFAKAN